MTFYVVRPIDQWPGELTKYRKRSPFETAFPATERLLEREIWYLRGTNVVLQLAISEWDLRADGGMRANARPAQHPGVIVSFDSKHGPLQYATDQFYDWQSNVRAIALSLEKLRAVDRYGVSTRGEQYKGWAALPPPADHMSPAEASALLHRYGGFRAAAKATHPDTGGDAVQFRRITAAKAVLERDGVPVLA